MRVLLVDNYDSFTYNLLHLLEQYTSDVTVLRNNTAIESVAEFDKIILSPGPGLPQEAGNLHSIIQEYAASKSILGVCLGHQAIGEVFDANLLKIKPVKHGEVSTIKVLDSSEKLFEGIPDSFSAGHYHSWVVDPNSLSADWKMTAESNGLLMAMSHLKYDLKGVQFHPESVMTPLGSQIISNWLKY